MNWTSTKESKLHDEDEKTPWHTHRLSNKCLCERRKRQRLRERNHGGKDNGFEDKDEMTVCTVRKNINERAT